MKGSEFSGRRLKGAWACPAAEDGREMEERLVRPPTDDPQPGLHRNERELILNKFELLPTGAAAAACCYWFLFFCTLRG
jgi:hypothetical protein